jgi:hypothetical protein
MKCGGFHQCQRLVPIIARLLIKICTVKNVEFAPPNVQETPQVAPTNGWRTVSFISWIAVLAALIAVAISSRTIGRPVWWLGSRFHPAPAIFMLVPLSVIVTPLVATWRAPEIMVRTSVICSLLLAGTAIPDIATSPATALGVFVVALASFLSSIAQVMVARKYR